MRVSNCHVTHKTQEKKDIISKATETNSIEVVPIQAPTGGRPIASDGFAMAANHEVVWLAERKIVESRLHSERLGATC